MNELPDGSISIPFAWTDGVFTLRDTIVISPTELAMLLPGQLEALQQARFEAWLQLVTTVPSEAV
jgi:hypothetical protein